MSGRRYKGPAALRSVAVRDFGPMDEFLNWAVLDARKHELGESFRQAKPFRWLMLDGFLNDDPARQLHDEFGEVVTRANKDPYTDKKHRHVLGKVGVMKRDAMNEVHRQFFDAIQTPRFLGWLEDVTGIRPVYPDAGLKGGGLHEIYERGYLNIHTDFNFHPETGSHRRLNLLYYLNPGWDEAWEGHLELWPADFSAPFARIAPLMNRMALFETSEISFHGHPTPLRPPDGVTRRSLAVYYYSEWPDGLERREWTNYQLVPWQVTELKRRISKLRAKGHDDDRILKFLSKEWQRTDVMRVMQMLTREPVSS
jgi:Rps23 Pro-64 3,4-dihydroxylase Tpa1-like proline 4-hydroxylase